MNDNNELKELPEGLSLVVVTLVFEGALLIIAAGLGRAFGIDPWGEMRFSLMDVFYGLFGGLVLTWVIAELIDLPWRFLDGLKRDADLLVVTLKNLSILHILLISLTAGIAEEIFFRGILQVYFSGKLGVTGGLVAASLVFGLVHFVSISYVVFVFFFGLFFGVLYVWLGDLSAAIIAHAVYDFAALTWAIHYRKSSFEDRA